MDPTRAAAHLVGSQGDAMKMAASNQGGAAMAFMGMNMAGQAGGMNAQNLYAMGQQQAAAQPAQQAAENGDPLVVHPAGPHGHAHEIGDDGDGRHAGNTQIFHKSPPYDTMSQVLTS